MFEDDLQNFSLDGIEQKPASTFKSGLVPPSSKNPSRSGSKKSPSLPKPNESVSLPRQTSTPSKTPFFYKKRFWLGFLGTLIFTVLALGGFKFISLAQRIFGDKSPFSFLSSVGKLAISDDRKITVEAEQEVNILLLGIGGEGHQGGTLTDTIILATVKPRQGDTPGEISLLSIPRDFIVKLPDGLDYLKINSAYAYGELKEKGLGAKWSVAAVEEWTGEKIPYYAVIDFAGFKEAIDELDGIDIYIDRSFSDSFYPNEKYGYLPTLHFKEGWEHMDGERALQYVRSRHGTNGEGSDFARSKRQQKVLSAVKERASKLKLSTDLGTVTKLLDTFSRNFNTNLEPWEIKRLYDLVKEVQQDNIFPLALDYDSGLICSEIVPETGASVLTVCPGKTKVDVQNFAQSRLEVARLRKEAPKILFQNSTKNNFLAQRVASKLGLPSATSETANYPGGEPLPTSVIYDLSDDKKPESLKFLQEKLGTRMAGEAYPYLDRLNGERPDIIVVVGLDAVAKFPPQ